MNPPRKHRPRSVVPHDPENLNRFIRLRPGDKVKTRTVGFPIRDGHSDALKRDTRSRYGKRVK